MLDQIERIKASLLLKTLTLFWINWQRVKRGHRPLLRIRDGERYRSTRCPVARSLCSNGSVFVGWKNWDDSQGVSHPLPEFVRRFVCEIDTIRWSPKDP
jgi:hypothetical protein